MLFTGTLITEKCSKIIDILASISKYYIINIDKYCWEFKNYNEQYFIKYNIEKEDFINYNLIESCTIKINIESLAKHLKINAKLNIQIDDNYNLNIIKNSIQNNKLNSITKLIIHGEQFLNDMDFYNYDYDLEMITNHIKFRDLVNILIDSNKSKNIINIQTNENNVVNFKSLSNGSEMAINPIKSFDDEIDDITNKMKIISMISKLKKNKNQSNIKTHVYIKSEIESLNMSYNLDILKYFEPIYNLVKYVNIGLSNNTEIKMDMILDEEIGNMINILVNNES